MHGIQFQCFIMLIIQQTRHTFNYQRNNNNTSIIITRCQIHQRQYFKHFISNSFSDCSLVNSRNDCWFPKIKRHFVALVLIITLRTRNLYRTRKCIPGLEYRTQLIVKYVTNCNKLTQINYQLCTVCVRYYTFDY